MKDIKELIRNLFMTVAIALLLAISYNYFSPNGIPLFGFESDLKVLPDSVLISEKENTSFITDISIEQAIRLIEQNRVILIDARSEKDFLSSHLVGSINIPFKNFDAHSDKIFQYSQGATFLIYCESIQCNLSHELAKVLSQFGFKKIFIMKEGIQEWEKRGLPLSN